MRQRIYCPFAWEKWQALLCTNATAFESPLVMRGLSLGAFITQCSVHALLWHLSSAGCVRTCLFPWHPSLTEELAGAKRPEAEKQWEGLSCSGSECLVEHPEPQQTELTDKSTLILLGKKFALVQLLLVGVVQCLKGKNFLIPTEEGVALWYGLLMMYNKGVSL